MLNVKRTTHRKQQRRHKENIRIHVLVTSFNFVKKMKVCYADCNSSDPFRESMSVGNYASRAHEAGEAVEDKWLSRPMGS